MGDTFGKYELVKQIAQGVTAEVFLAKLPGENGAPAKHVAIKRVFPHLTEDQETVDMFLDEGRSAAALAHANIVQILEVGIEDGMVFIAMEYVHGRDLRSILEEGFTQDNFIPIELAASVGAHVAGGLHFAHSQNGADGEPMIHRDISPQNILVSVDGGVKICDFGVAKAEHWLSQTKPGQAKGKFSYMAPEQIETSHVDARSDVFALGIVLYEMTTMTRLFRAENQYEALEKILYAGIEPPTALRAGYPPELEKIVMMALERDPSARQQSAGQMQEEIDNWLVQNQASTSPVAIARYMRGLFPVLSRPIVETISESTGPMQVSEEVVAAVDGKRRDKPVVVATPAASESAEMKKKDVTEMNEDDLDAALDFALGAPSEADVVLQRPTSEAQSDPAPAPPPIAVASAPPAEYVDDDPTVISERAPEVAELDLAQRTAPAKPIVPTVTHEPQVPTVGAEKSEPAAAPAAPAAAPAVAPPAARSGSIPTAPSAAMKPPAASSAESRARAAFGEDEPKHSDLSLDELADASGLSTKRTGMVIGVIFVVALLAVVLVYAMSLDTSGSEMEQEVERTQIDPDMLVVETAAKAERVMAAIETTPADASVIVNGLPVEVAGGKIPLAKGTKNEVAVYAPGHKPARLFVDGDGSGSPISVTLELMVEVLPEETADLNIRTEPRDATIWVDGVEVGKSPTTVAGLWTGAEHHVYIEHEGRYPYVGFVNLVKKSENLVDTTLAKSDSGRKNYVEVIFAAIPRGSVVQLEGEPAPLGMTPFFKNIDRNTMLTVNFEDKDSIPMQRRIALEDVGTFELRPFLEPMAREKGTITIYVEPMGPEIYVGANAYGQGPAGNIVLPEGPVKVVLDTPHGREEVAVSVVANTHTRYMINHDKAGVKVSKRD